MRNKKIEIAVYAASVADIRRTPTHHASGAVPPPPQAGEGRIYFGAEFCQWRLPSARALSNALSAARDKGVSFTLLTPWVTDAGMRKLRTLFAVLRDEALESEVVVNDLGALVMLRDEYPELTPVLGRVLVRQKTCPRVPAIIEDLPPEGREIYMRTGAEDPVSARLLRRYGVKRVELDYPLQGLETDFTGTKLKASLYTPYAFVTLTRYCPASFDGKTWQAFSGCRIKGCKKNILELKNPAHDAPLLMRGNAQFIKGHGLPDTLPDGIDRIVYMGSLP